MILPEICKITQEHKFNKKTVIFWQINSSILEYIYSISKVISTRYFRQSYMINNQVCHTFTCNYFFLTIVTMSLIHKMKHACMYLSLPVFCEGADYFGVSSSKSLLELSFLCPGIGPEGTTPFFSCIIRRVSISLLTAVRLAASIWVGRESSLTKELCSNKRNIS